MSEDKDIVFDVIVIGAGPAGIMAAGMAAGRGRRTLLLEKNDTLGKKLLISGKGRCNLTNVGRDVEEFLREFSESGPFLRNAFCRYFNTELMEFFEKRGLSLKVEQGGRVFPKSDKARDVLRVLIGFLEKSGVRILNNSEVRGLKKTEKNFAVILKNKNIYFASKVVLATGGLSYPQTGSDGLGLKLAERLGHTVIEPRPGLVAINLKSELSKTWQGITLKNVECAVELQSKIIGREFGEMIFTHFGISGPIVLDLSAKIYDAIEKRKTVSISIDFNPALTAEKLDKRLLREFSASPNKNLENILKELLPRRLIKGFLSRIPLDGKKKANQITKAERQKIVNSFKCLRFDVQATRPIDEAIITRGGVSTVEINPQTMESRLMPGLYFAGEIIDVDAKTGGYNMQAAFSTGYICGINV